jgi:hypothetical protein
MTGLRTPSLIFSFKSQRECEDGGNAEAAYCGAKHCAVAAAEAYCEGCIGVHAEAKASAQQQAYATGRFVVGWPCAAVNKRREDPEGQNQPDLWGQRENAPVRSKNPSGRCSRHHDKRSRVEAVASVRAQGKSRCSAARGHKEPRLKAETKICVKRRYALSGFWFFGRSLGCYRAWASATKKPHGNEKSSPFKGLLPASFLARSQNYSADIMPLLPPLLEPSQVAEELWKQELAEQQLGFEPL